MGAPVIETIRSGVQFTRAAAASFRRVEARLGRRMDVNSTYRNWNKQWSMYVNWNAYVSGDGPYPGHSRAIHPDLSKHCQGLACDSDDWATPGFIALMAEHGWIRTAPNDPTERHHFEYQSWRDQHVGELAGDGFTIIEPELEYDMPIKLYNTEKADAKGRRHAWLGEFSFQELDLGAAQDEWRAIPGEVISVDQAAWDGYRLRALARASEIRAFLNQSAIDYPKLAAEVAKLLPNAATPTVPTAAENAAEVIRQMKLPGN